jgi:hypothetical protein
MANAVSRYARPAIVGALLASALFNGYGFAAMATGYLIAPAALLGVMVTAMVFCLVKIATALFLGHR